MIIDLIHRVLLIEAITAGFVQGRNHEGAEQLSMMESCPTNISIPKELGPMAPLECWPAASNHHCYCFTPKVFVNGDKQNHGVVWVIQLTCLTICRSINMSCVALETKEESQIVGKILLDQQEALTPAYWTKGLYDHETSSYFWPEEVPHKIEGQKRPGPVVTYTDWAPGYPTTQILNVNFGIVLECSATLRDCKWKNVDSFSTSVGSIMCEATLDPSFKIPISARFRKAQMKEFYPNFVENSGSAPKEEKREHDVEHTGRSLAFNSRVGERHLLTVLPIIMPTLIVTFFTFSKF